MCSQEMGSDFFNYSGKSVVVYRAKGRYTRWRLAEIDQRIRLKKNR